MPEEPKLRDKVVDFPPNLKAELEVIHTENRKTTKEFIRLSENYFTILFAIKGNLDKREQQGHKRQKLTERAFKHLRLDRNLPWQCDYDAAQFYTVKKEDKSVVEVKNDKPN